MKLLLGGLLASGVLVATMAAVIELKNREEAELRSVIAAWDACSLEVMTGNQRGPASACVSHVAQAALTARRSGRCDQALAGTDRFAVDAACSAPVKTVVAERDVRTRERDGLQGQLNQLRADRAQAIAAAEQRGRTQTQRTQRAEDDLAAAPRTDAGLGRCDAECLRDLGRAAAPR